MENFFNSPIMRDGKRIEFEDVVKELERDTVMHQMTSARDMSDPEGIIIQARTEPENYANLLRWLRTLMFDSILDPARLKAVVSRLLADIPETKRDGRLMSAEIDVAIRTVEDSFQFSRRTLVKGRLPEAP